jgi:signal transduction histidine kinase
MAGFWSLEERLRYFGYGEEDRRLLADLAGTLESSADTLVAAFYRHVLSHPGPIQLLRDPATKERLLGMQRKYLLSLAGPRIDSRYAAERRSIGETHNRIGLEPGWYLGAYAVYLALLTPLVLERYSGDGPRAGRSLLALQKLLLFDASIAMDAYIESRESELAFLNLELSNSGQELARDLETSGAELRRTTERARAAEQLASVGVLVAGLAHEIGTPMGVIQGHAKLLETKVADESARWRLRTIQEQIARISKIIRSLLKMARPERLERRVVALPMVLDGTLSFIRESLQHQGIRIDRRYEPIPEVMADPERLQQVFLNLFVNAADAMSGGGVLTVRLHPEAEKTVGILISDSGPGMSAEVRARAFEPFFTTKGAGGGSGLGLSVAHSIIVEHGGKIDVRSEVGAGTTFRIVLPAA